MTGSKPKKQPKRPVESWSLEPMRDSGLEKGRRGDALLFLNRQTGSEGAASKRAWRMTF
jgi:hypothetical protein